jgi:hypothetical protein
VSLFGGVVGPNRINLDLYKIKIHLNAEKRAPALRETAIPINKKT